MQQGADDGFHAGGEDDDGDVLGERPFVEGLETGVEFDVLDQESYAFVVGCLRGGVSIFCDYSGRKSFVHLQMPSFR